MEWEGWTIVPIGNLNPVGINENDNKYDLQADPVCANQSQSGGSGVPYPPNLIFHMELNNLEDGIETISFDRKYAHSLDVSFWADCTDEDREGEPGEPYETWIADKHFSFSESFDCMIPEFDEEPIVLYGDEAAEFIHYELMGGLDPEPPNPPNPPNWPTSIPMDGENVNGDLYCYGTNRIFYSILMEDLMAHNCDLFIVTMAHDPTTQGTDGNMLWQHMVLDYKYTNETYRYGFSGGDPVTGVIAIDKKPWASTEYGAVNNREIVTDWLDPNYKQSPEGMWHDWCGSEIAIKWWNLTTILQTSEKEIQGIKVRITDVTQDPVDGYHGNWRRSDDVMEQVCNSLYMPERGGSAPISRYCPHEIIAEFIAKNPHDNSATNDEFKIVEFEADCNDEQTNYIIQMKTVSGYSTNWGAVIEIAAFLDFDDSVKPNPYNFPPPFIEAYIRSSESSEITGKSNKTSTYLFNFALNPPTGIDYIRLCELFGIDPEAELCDCHFYVGTLLVSDDLDETTFGELYLSNSDHKIPPGPRRRDCAITVSTKHIEVDAVNDPDLTVDPSTLNFGVQKGIGWNAPNQSNKEWYNYDDYIMRGGFETIELSKFTYPESAQLDVSMNFLGGIISVGPRYVPIISTADVLVIEAHGIYFGSTGDHSVSSMLGPFNFPAHHNYNHFDLNDTGFSNARYFTIDGYPTRQGYSVTNTKYPNDFYLDAINPDWNFWMIRGRPDPEIKWLVLHGCNTLDNSSSNTYKPRMRVKAVIDDGFFISACGFKDNSTAWYANQLLTTYSEILNEIVDNPKSGGYYYRTPHLYKDYHLNGGTNDFPLDPSVAAFMETCVELTSKEREDWHVYINNAILSASAIHYDSNYTLGEEWSSFHIMQSDEPVTFGWFWKRKEFNYYIVRGNVAWNPEL